MTMLNGEPVDMPNISTASPSPPRTPAPASPQSRQVGMVVGLLSLIFAFAMPLVGAILGGVAVAQARKGGYRNPMAMVGLVLGIVFTVLVTVGVVLFLVFGAGLLGDVVELCQQLGPGIHRHEGITVECN